MVTLSILMATAIVSFRFTDQDKSTIAADQLIADIQYVQMRAIGIGNAQNIQFTNGSSSYNVSGEQKNLPDGVTVISNTFNNILKFNSLGEPFFDSNSNCTNASAGSCYVTLRNNVTIMIYAITGKTCLFDTANNRCF